LTAEKGTENEKTGSGDGKSSEDSSKTEPPQGPKPLTKWQKLGYAFFGLTLINGVVMSAVIFCKSIHIFSFCTMETEN